MNAGPDPTTPTPLVRVLLVSTSFPRYRGDPAGAFVGRLAQALSSRANVTVLTPDSRMPSKACLSTTFRVRTFRYAPRRWQRLAHEPGGIPAALERSRGFWLLVPLFLLAMFFSTLRVARHVDVIHANWTVVGLVAGLAGRLTGTPVITTLRGEDITRVEHSLLARGALELAAMLSRKLVTVGSSMRLEVQGRLRPHRQKDVLHIGNGVDDDFFAISPIRRPHSGLRLVCIGSLIPRKAPDLLLDAMAALPASVKVDLVGNGPLRGPLEQKVLARGLEQQVRLLGDRSTDAIPALLEHYDVLVLTSRAEGRPNVVTEAMAAGRVVVATDLPGTRELIEPGDSGLLFPVGDTAALVECLRQLLTEPERVEQLGNAARARIRELGLAWPDCAERYVRVYSTIVQRGS